MGTLDFLKDIRGKVVDAVTYELLQRNFEMLDQNNRLLKDKADLQTAQITELTGKVDELEAENRQLRESLAQMQREGQFVTLEGFAFLQRTDGTLDETPYCPTCHKVMGSIERRKYKCSSCGHEHRSRSLPSVYARQYNSDKAHATPETVADELILAGDVYTSACGEGPFCTRCYDMEQLQVRLAKLPEVFHSMGRYECPQCKQLFMGSQQ